MRSGFALLNASWREVYHIASSETQGQSVGSGEKAGRKFLLRSKEPLGTDSHRTISKNSSRCRLLIGRKKLLCIIVPNRRTHLLSSFRVFVHDGYCLDHGLSGSCTKEMHAVRKLSVWYKIPIWSNSLTLSNASELFWSWISINHIQVHEENEFCHCLFTSFTKREIRHFHG